MFAQTLASFETEWRYRADLQGLGTSVGRHPSANLLPVFNGAYRDLIEQALEYGYTQFLSRGTTTNLPTTPVEAGESYAVIATDATIRQIKKIDVRPSGGNWITLEEITALQLRDYGASSTPARVPRGWCWLDSGVTATTMVGHVAVTPVPQGGQYALWTMPEFTPLVLTTDSYVYHAECWRKWHIYKAMLEVCVVRDKNSQNVWNAIAKQLDPANEGSPAHQLKNMAPTASGAMTWTRSPDYNNTRGWGR